MNEKSIAIIIGSHGTGKTTLANVIRKKIHAETIIFDNIQIQINNKQKIQVQEAINNQGKNEKIVIVVQPSEYIFHRFNYLLDHNIVWIFTNLGPDIETLKQFFIPMSLIRKFNEQFKKSIINKRKFRPYLSVTVDPDQKRIVCKMGKYKKIIEEKKK